jgi:tyrosinase
VASRFRACLNAPNYTLFSNGTSAGAYNKGKPQEQKVVPLESPHDSIHLAIGGFTKKDGTQPPV